MSKSKKLKLKLDKPWQVKYEAIKRILKNETFALLSFERENKDSGFVEGLFTRGFNKSQIKDLLDSAQSTHEENILADNFKSVAEEAKQILNSK